MEGRTGAPQPSRYASGPIASRMSSIPERYAVSASTEACRTPSSAPAYRSGIELIREAIGEDAYLLGCGAPLLPSSGLFDAMRVSPDTAPQPSR